MSNSSFTDHLANLVCFFRNFSAALVWRDSRMADLSGLSWDALGRARVATFECVWNSRTLLFSVLNTTLRRLSPPDSSSLAAYAWRFWALDFFFLLFLAMVRTSSLPVLPASPWVWLFCFPSKSALPVSASCYDFFCFFSTTAGVSSFWPCWPTVLISSASSLP